MAIEIAAVRRPRICRGLWVSYNIAFTKTMELTLTLALTLILPDTEFCAPAVSMETAVPVSADFRGHGWYDGVAADRTVERAVAFATDIRRLA